MINLGLLSAATISPRSVVAPARQLEAIHVYAVAASNEQRAYQFAKQHGISHYYADYASLLSDKNIDAVYIALPNHLHAKWIIAAAEAKKHILVEKPICINHIEIKFIQKAIQDNHIHLLEGVMTQHHPWQVRIKNIMDSKILGQLLKIKTVQTFRLEDKTNYRFNQQFGGGVFFDEACYWLNLLQVLSLLPIEQLSKEVKYTHNADVDTTFWVMGITQSGVEIEALFSYEMPYEAVHYLTFSQGKLRIRNFLAPSLGKFRIKFDIQYNDSRDAQTLVFEPDNYFRRQLEFFSNVISGEANNLPLSQSFERIEHMLGIYYCDT
jgi:predicted dehydrogenase